MPPGITASARRRSCRSLLIGAVIVDSPLTIIAEALQDLVQLQRRQYARTADDQCAQYTAARQVHPDAGAAMLSACSYDSSTPKVAGPRATNEAVPAAKRRA